jgi:Flp pilus assembly protein TadD
LALKLKADDPDTHYYLGRALLARNQTSEAIDSLQKATRLMPDDAKAHNVLAVALVEASQRLQAIEELETACRLDPTNPLFQANLKCAKRDLQNCVLAP